MCFVVVVVLVVVVVVVVVLFVLLLVLLLLFFVYFPGFTALSDYSLLTAIIADVSRICMLLHVCGYQQSSRGVDPGQFTGMVGDLL